MSCSKLMRSTSMEIMRENKIIDEQGNIKNLVEFNKMEASLKEQFSKLYDKNFTAPFGTVKNGKLTENKAADTFQQGLRKKGKERYDGVTAKPFDIGDGTMLLLDPKTLFTLSIDGVANTFAKTVVNGEIVKSALTIEDLYNKTTIPGLKNLVEDLHASENADIMMAYMPTLMGAYKVQHVKGQKAENQWITKEGSAKENMESNLVANASIEQTTMNEQLNVLLESTGTNYNVTIGRDGVGNRGSANTTNITISPFNIGMTEATDSFNKAIAQTYLHEKAHIATIGLMNKDAAFRKSMQEVYEYTKTQIGNSAYGMTDVFEFAAEALSNPEFQATLARVPSKSSPKTLLGQFFTRVREAIENALGKRIDGSVLEEVLDMTDLASRKAIVSNLALNSISLDTYNVFDNITQDGTFVGQVDELKVAKFAQQNGVFYSEGKFYVNSTKATQLDKDTLSAIADDSVDNFYYRSVLQGNATVGEYINKLDNMEPIPQTVSYLKSQIDINAVEGSLDKLKQINENQIQIPAERNAEISNIVDTTDKDIRTMDMYAVNKEPYFRVTSYLGFGVEDPNSMYLKNAQAIGNVADELSKQVFSEGANDLSYETVTALVKEERYKYEQSKFQRTRYTFNKEYVEPINKASFEEMRDSMIQLKGEMMKQYDIKEFHSDIRVWDEKIRVAGEMDILAEHNDGSFTVIDMKTSRQGMTGFDAEQDSSWNKTSKYTMQTNLYSDMMQDMGFTVNPPMLIVAKTPLYDNVDYIENGAFLPIEDNNLLKVVELKRIENKNYFNYNVGKIIGKGQREVAKELRQDSLRQRSAYETWYETDILIQDLMNQTSVLGATKEELQTIQDQFKVIDDVVSRYASILTSNKTKKDAPKVIKDLQKSLEAELNTEISKLSVMQQLTTATDFFNFGQNELAMLLRNTQNNEDAKQAYIDLKNYHGMFKTASELYANLDMIMGNVAVPSPDFVSMKESYEKFNTLNSKVKSRLDAMRKGLTQDILTEAYLGSKFEIEAIEEMRLEIEQANPGISRAKLDSIVTERRSTEEFRDRIIAMAGKEMKELTSNTQHDMSETTLLVNSDVMVNNTYVQLVHTMLMVAKQKYAEVANKEVVELYNQFKELNLSKSEQKELIVVGDKDTSYLIGDVTIEYLNEFNAMKKVVRDLREAEVPKGQEKARTAEIYAAQAAVTKWKKDNTELTADMEARPIAKWRNDLSHLSSRQLQALDIFKGITESNESRIGKKSLKVPTAIDNVFFYKLPGVKATTYENITSGKWLDGLKNLTEEATKNEVDDVEYGSQSITEDGVLLMATGLDGKAMYSVPVQFRGTTGKRQSTDLFTIYALEKQNGIRFEIDQEMSTNAVIVQDMVDNTKFYKTIKGMRVASKLTGKKTHSLEDTIDGDASVTSKMINKMFQARVYNITQEYAGQIAGQDIQRVMSTVSTYTAFAAMSFKGLGAMNNLVTGNVSVLVEAMGGEFITVANMAKGASIYAANSMGIAADMGSAVKTNKVNQLMMRLNVMGDSSILNNEFEKKNKATQFANLGTSLLGYSMGEHQIHATLMLSMLDAIKVTNKKGQWIDINGKVVKDKKDAASLADAYTTNEKNELELAKWAEYTDFDTQNPLHGAGEASIIGLIKDKVTRTQGAYSTDTQSMLDRLWYGKLFKQFKKHIAPQMLNRFRGVSTVHKDRAELKDNERYHNYNTKSEEFGYYTTFMRHIIAIAKEHKLNLLAYKEAGSNAWKNMSRHERANIKKLSGELSYIATVFGLALLAAGAAADDDDNKWMWMVATLLRRQASDSGAQYFYPPSMWRLAKDPISAVQHLDSSIALMWQGLDPSEEYVSGVNAGENKAWTMFKRATIVGSLDRQFEQSYAKQAYNALDQ